MRGLCDREGTGAPAAPSGVISPGPAPGREATPEAVLVGGDDIASCDVEEDAATAEFLDGIEGTVRRHGIAAPISRDTHDNLV